MKKSYIKPDTQIVTISPLNSLLQDPGVYGPGVSKETVATDMDSNSSLFDDGDEWSMPSNKSLWDD